MGSKPVFRYVYHVERLDTGVWYRGSRTSTRPPLEDIGHHYFTSSRNQEFRNDFRTHPDQWRCSILEEGFLTNEAMLTREREWIVNHWNTPGRINRSAYPVKFELDPDWRRKQAEGVRKRSQDSNWRRNHADANRKKAQDPDWRRKHAEGARKRSQDPEYREKIANAARKKAQDPDWRRKQAEGVRKRSQDPDWRRNQAEAGRKRAQDPNWRRNNADAMRKKAQDPEYREKIANANRKKAQDPEWRRKHAEAQKRRRARERAARREDSLSLFDDV